MYWSGAAALAFLTDVAARRAGGPTLDDALRSFAGSAVRRPKKDLGRRAECWLASTGRWAQTPRASRRWQRLGSDRTEFPEVNGVLRELGVAPGLHDEASFQHAPDALIRDAIMALAPEPSVAGANRDPHQSQ